MTITLRLVWEWAVGFIDWLGGWFIASERGKSASDRLQRCGHPGQQHGLRMPPRILSMPTSMRRFLVASCLAEVTQQIHSFSRQRGDIDPETLGSRVRFYGPPEVCW